MIARLPHLLTASIISFTVLSFWSVLKTLPKPIYIQAYHLLQEIHLVPLAQTEFAANLLMACKQEEINTAIETCGYTNLESILKVAGFTDLFLFDIKHIDPERHYKLTGVRNEQILENLKELLRRRYNVKVRMPLLKGINDNQDEIERVIALMPFRDYKNFKGIDILPYHKLGVNKYTQLGKEYPIKEDPSLSIEELNMIESWVEKYEFQVAVIKH